MPDGDALYGKDVPEGTGVDGTPFEDKGLSVEAVDRDTLYDKDVPEETGDDGTPLDDKELSVEADDGGTLYDKEVPGDTDDVGTLHLQEPLRWTPPCSMGGHSFHLRRCVDAGDVAYCGYGGLPPAGGGTACTLADVFVPVMPDGGTLYDKGRAC